jgi:hypothetical protein
MSRVTKTLKPLLQINSDQTEFLWMSFAEDSPAKTSHTRGGVQAWRAQDQDYGAKLPALLATYDRNTSSWKMSQHSLVEGLDEFSETWPRSGMMRNGIAYRLPPLALRTDGIESGLWPTPQASDNRDRGNLCSGAVKRRRERGKQISLSQSVSEVSGQLNPTWVEWLMGYPPGYTDCVFSGTPSSRK